MRVEIEPGDSIEVAVVEDGRVQGAIVVRAEADGSIAVEPIGRALSQNSRRAVPIRSVEVVPSPTGVAPLAFDHGSGVAPLAFDHGSGVAPLTLGAAVAPLTVGSSRERDAKHAHPGRTWPERERPWPAGGPGGHAGPIGPAPASPGLRCAICGGPDRFMCVHPLNGA